MSSLLQRVRREYAALAAFYDSRWRHYLTRTHAETLALTPPLAGGVVLDAGCGTGGMLAQLRGHCPEAMLVGVDASEHMLEQISPSLAVRGVCGEFVRLPLADASVQAVVSCSALHYEDDPLRAAEEMRRVLTEGGWLVLTDWRAEHPLTAFRCARLRFTRRPLGHVLRTREAVKVLERSSFRVERLHRFTAGGWGLFAIRAVAV